MLVGAEEGVLRGFRVTAIHTQRYYDMVWSPAGEPDGRVPIRAPFEEVYLSPAVGDRIRVHFVMGVVTRVEKATG